MNGVLDTGNIEIKKGLLGLVATDKGSSGGQGTVYTTTRKMVLNGKITDVVYKEYSSKSLAHLNHKVLREMAGFLLSLPTKDQHFLLSHAAWPTHIVEDNGRIVGFLMAKAPIEYTIELPLPSGNVSTKLAGFQYLLESQKFRKSKGINLTELLRYGLLKNIADTIHFFHGHEIVVGDLSPKNILFALNNSSSSVYFIDCDSMKFKGRNVLPTVETPDWDVASLWNSVGGRNYWYLQIKQWLGYPEFKEPLDTSKTDCYKFGLLALRLFAQTQSLRNYISLPVRVSPKIRALIKCSLSRKPKNRPKMEEWVIALNSKKISWYVKFNIITDWLGIRVIQQKHLYLCFLGILVYVFFILFQKDIFNINKLNFATVVTEGLNLRKCPIPIDAKCPRTGELKNGDLVLIKDMISNNGVPWANVIKIGISPTSGWINASAKYLKRKNQQ